ncbi:uncharacterized protein LOC117231101 [Bombus vosnesenskii]|uniref:Uncharacterized protein LOC117231101 n=3 Tax=Pyrobombus TaxID=144703 RepID=A0A6J3JY84_9HYME|nr:uncharacterized protein LOC112213249 [Bombus impatiens]XP_033191759.1 uncharacterized protein LOC117157658 [Bombus vancouverensis nearcticus]XP_033299078.1 uncharacterized protein LOC117205101 [Bombus bifarius]XP_033345089.1 uncharacterized protein LOC117231101 [Bombus vosnesenskii]
MQINLRDKKVFEIASDNKDYDEQSENEMIQPKELRNLNFYIEDENRYRPLHSYVDSYNKHETINKIQHTNMYFHLKSKIWENSNIGEDDAPFIAGFKENLDKIIKDRNSKFAK